MNKTRALLILFLILLTINIIISEQTNYKIRGEVKELHYTKNKITLKIEEDKNEYIIFTKEMLNLKKGDRIEIEGKKEFYKNKEQIIVNKIKKQNN